MLLKPKSLLSLDMFNLVSVNKFQMSRLTFESSVVECLTRDQEATGSSLTGVTVLWSLSKTFILA